MTDQIIDYINIITAVVTVASLIANVTPTKKDDAIMSKVKGFIDLVALNFRKG